ncbi:hypothetical protein BDZ97DRAFT_1930186 [Flammula alnicola]|nr:hypothetical protein BDZ97DRAFT_1930186 [Flammula alnicola]
MDNLNLLYDINQAGQKLERIALEHINSPHSGLNAAQLTNEEDWALGYTTIQSGALWRLAFSPTADGTEGMEEVVMSFQGIISKMDLPPFREKLSDQGNRARFLRQSITVTATGMGYPSLRVRVSAGTMGLNTRMGLL